MSVIACATISSPKGGPKDSIPPRLVAANPIPYSTNFKGKKAVFEFDEFIKLQDQSKLFFVSPQPVKKPILMAKGKRVEVNFQDTLLENQTYRLDFGASVVDNNESVRLPDFSVTFSTGDRVDSLVMVGQTLDALSRDTLIGAFMPFFDLSKDSTYFQRGFDSTVIKSRAEALFRTDSSGYFVADILKGKDYRLYSYLDNNGNQLYEAGIDLVAFTETTVNPLDGAPFSFGYDSVARRMYIDSLQVVMELFKEVMPLRQRLAGESRPQRGEFLFSFGAPDGKIDSLEVLDSIPSEWILEERNLKGDSLRYFIAPPEKALFDSLPDTLMVAYVYYESDSVMNLQGVRDTVKLVYTEPVKELTPAEKAEQERKADEEKREAKRKEREEKKKKKEQEELEEKGLWVEDSVAMDSIAMEQMVRDSIVRDSLVQDSISKIVNPFTMKFSAATSFNPEEEMFLTFGYPILSADSSRIVLVQSVTEKEKGARKGDESGTKTLVDTVDVNITVDGLRRLKLESDWAFGASYELIVNDSIFVNTAWQTNDSISYKFKVLDPDEFATISVKLEAGSPILVMDSLAVDSLVTDSLIIDTLIKETLVLDSLVLDSLVVDSLVVDSLVVDSLVVDSLIVDSLVIDTIVVERVPDEIIVDSTYIVELVKIDPKMTARGSNSDGDKSSQTVVQTKINVKPGEQVTFKFLKPEEKYYIRVIEDRNGDGQWTTGSMTNRRMPEKSRLVMQSNGKPKPIEGRKNTEMIENVTLSEIFKK